VSMAPYRSITGQLGLVEAVADVRTGRTTCEELTKRAVDTAQSHAKLNAVITLDAEQALSSAWQSDRERSCRGPLWGIPIVINDNIHVAGLPNTAGTPALADFVPTTDALVVSRLRAAGALVIAKTNLHEMSLGVTGGESATGPVRNAWDPNRLAGGGSAGAAVMVALGVLAGLGTDTCGSVRIPAALNGVCALRPSVGRYPANGVTPMSVSRDTVGPIAATMADLTLLHSVLADEHPGTETYPRMPPRLGVPVTYRSGPCERAALECFERALDRLRSKGVIVVEVRGFPLEGIERRIGIPILAYELRRELGHYLHTYQTKITVDDLADRIRGPGVRDFFRRHLVCDATRVISAVEYDLAFTRGRAEVFRQYRHVFRTYQLDALVLPTTPHRASTMRLCDPPPAAEFAVHPAPGSLIDLPELAQPAPSANAHAADVFTRHTSPGGIVGLPGLTLPMPTEDGLPAGLALDGYPGGDRALLALGRELERML
jgi:indoleacetamide hydrolase